MRRLLIFGFALCISLTALAQSPGNRNFGRAQDAPNIGLVYGKLVDSAGKPVSDASILILQSKMDSSTKKLKEVLLKGTTSKANGDFRFEELPARGMLKLQISATGYRQIDQPVSFMPSETVTDPSNTAPNFEKDLGRMIMETDAEQMEAVTVFANTGRLRMDIDKKVFNVDKNIVSAGGTAVDVLRNVPSVNVDIDGNISLRNASPQLFIDGRPTTLTLEQIPADAIESVEVITNPSAKYDASGGGAGILNIVLKKNRKTGYNGNVRAGIDRLGAGNGGADFNVRQDKVNFFGSFNINQRKSNTEGSVDRSNLTGDPLTNIHQVNEDLSKGRFMFGRAGLDYFMTNRTTLSLAGFKMNARFHPNEIINSITDSLFNTGTVSKFSQRTAPGEREFNGQGLAFGLKHLFPKEGEEFTADANYFSGSGKNSTVYTTNYFSGEPGTSIERTLRQKLEGSGKDHNLVMQMDYVKPLSSKAKVETGVRASLRGRDNNNYNFLFDDSASDYVLLPSTVSNYKNSDKVYAAYVNLTNSFKNFGYAIGLRAESSGYQGELTQSGEKFSNQYPISLFPSLFVSQKLSGSTELQASYTRKINRPNFFQLIPFADYTDELNITQGNPDLVPEFTNSYEMSFSKTFPKNNSLLASVYYKKTNNLITRYIEQGENPFTGKEALINTYINAASSQSYGTEFTVQNSIASWWDLTTNINLYNSVINTDDKTNDVKGIWSWFGKVNSNFKLPSQFTVQLSGIYQSKTILTPGGNSGFGGPPGARGGSGGGSGGGGFGQAQSAAQGYIKPYYGIDFAIKKSFLKNNAASATLSFSDIFRTRGFEQHSESEFFIQDYNRLRDPQMVRLTLNYRFGKMDASLFKRKNTRSEDSQLQGM